MSGGKKHLSLLILHILNLLVEILDFRVERINSRGLALDLRSQDLGYVESCQEIMVRASLEQRQSQRSSPRLSALCEIYKLRSTGNLRVTCSSGIHDVRPLQGNEGHRCNYVSKVCTITKKEYLDLLSELLDCVLLVVRLLLAEARVPHGALLQRTIQQLDKAYLRSWCFTNIPHLPLLLKSNTA